MAFKKDKYSSEDNKDYPEIVDDDSYTSGDGGGINIKKIIGAHINRISENIFKVNKSNKNINDDTDESFVSNAERREVFIDAIDYLVSILTPYFDKDMTKALETSKGNIEVSLDKLLNASIEKEAYKRASGDKAQFVTAYRWWLDKLKKMKVDLLDRSSTEHEMYIDSVYKNYNNLFVELNKLLHRLDYLSLEDYTE